MRRRQTVVGNRRSQFARGALGRQDRSGRRYRPGGSHAAAPNGDFASWLAAFRTEALESGISAETVHAALADVEPLPRVLELDGSQPRGPHDFCGYVKRRLTPTRIARAKRMLDEHGELLNQLRDEYGVPPRYLVAVWGLETNFGDYMGDYPVVPALATLAYDPRRGDAFREQLLAALQIIDEAGPSYSWNPYRAETRRQAPKMCSRYAR